MLVRDDALQLIESRAGLGAAALYAVANAKRELSRQRDALMEEIHRARCNGVRWRAICFSVCRGRGLPPGDALVIAEELRKGLSLYRQKLGLMPCPRLVSRTTVVIESIG